MVVKEYLLFYVLMINLATAAISVSKFTRSIPVRRICSVRGMSSSWDKLPEICDNILRATKS